MSAPPLPQLRAAGHKHLTVRELWDVRARRVLRGAWGMGGLLGLVVLGLGGGVVGAQPGEGWREAQAAVDQLATEVLRELVGGETAGGGAESQGEFDLVSRTRTFYGELSTVRFDLPVSASAGETAVGRVAHANSPIRSRPSAAVDRFAQAAKGARVFVLASVAGWSKVLFDNGTVGWMADGDVRVIKTLGNSNVEALVQTALRHRGIRYLWGGTTERGMDCSGLVYRILRSSGLRPPRTAAQQYRLGVPVSRGGIRRGDLVFFENTYKPGISHVGIALDGERFIHASSGKGEVTVGRLGSSYYREHYAGARRLSRVLPASGH